MSPSRYEGFCRSRQSGLIYRRRVFGLGPLSPICGQAAAGLQASPGPSQLKDRPKSAPSTSPMAGIWVASFCCAHRAALVPLLDAFFTWAQGDRAQPLGPLGAGQGIALHHHPAHRADPLCHRRPARSRQQHRRKRMAPDGVACQAGGMSEAVVRLKIVLADTAPPIWGHGTGFPKSYAAFINQRQ